jgi:hypothetical protein
MESTLFEMRLSSLVVATLSTSLSPLILYVWEWKEGELIIILSRWETASYSYFCFFLFCFEASIGRREAVHCVQRLWPTQWKWFDSVVVVVGHSTGILYTRRKNMETCITFWLLLLWSECVAWPINPSTSYYEIFFFFFFISIVLPFLFLFLLSNLKNRKRFFFLFGFSYHKIRIDYLWSVTSNPAPHHRLTLNRHFRLRWLSG